MTQSTNNPQRTVSDAEVKAQQEANRFHEGKENSHKAQDSSTLLLLVPIRLRDDVVRSIHFTPLRLHDEDILTLKIEDERSIANKLEREQKRENESEEKSLEDRQREKDATLPARAHGNEPSKGAKIDQELREEDEAMLKKKGAN